MHWIATIIAGAIFALATFGGTWASFRGWGLPGAPEEPVNVRAESLAQAGRNAGPGTFGRRSRRHHHGGYHGGK